MDGTARTIQPICLERIWRRSFTDGSIEEAYGFGDGTADVMIMVIPPQEDITMPPVVIEPELNMKQEARTWVDLTA